LLPPRTDEQPRLPEHFPPRVPEHPAESGSDDVQQRLSAPSPGADSTREPEDHLHLLSRRPVVLPVPAADRYRRLADVLLPPGCAGHLPGHEGSRDGRDVRYALTEHP